MTVDFNQRKSAKKNSKRMSQKTEDGRRIRGGKTVPRKQRGMCASDPPLPPKLREEDEARAAAERNARKKEEKRKAAARALREKMAAKGVPGAAKPLSQMKGPNRGRGDDDLVSDSSDDDDDEPRGKDDEANEGAGVPEYFDDALKALGHRGSTPIQRECWPHACAGRDLLGVAPPGSGKTLAYLLPAVEFALRDARDNPAAKKRGAPAGEPSALVVAPTRELALQIFAVCGKLKRSAPVRCVSVYGGASQEEQEEQLAQPSGLALLVVGTPGRLVAVLESGALLLRRARMLVIDEADRMLALGFAEQLESLREALPANERDDESLARESLTRTDKKGMGSRPGRQTLMFSATFPKSVRAVAKAWLAPGPAIVKIEASDKSASAGKRSNEANVAVAAGGKGEGRSHDVSDVEQTVHVCAEHKKARKLLKHVTELRKNDGRSKSRVLVFANRIKTVNFVGETLRRHGEKVGCLHGELKQEKREAALRDFKSGKTPCLVATDVAGRGLDITGLEHVVNWDMPGSVEQYTHRVGRAGRSGRKGAALSFFTRNMAPLAPDLVKLLKKGGHFVDPNLETLAKVGAALNKGAEADLGQDEDDAKKESSAAVSVSEASEDDSASVSDEEETDDSDGDSEAEDSFEDNSEEENTEDESDDETSDGDATNALDELVDVFRSENGRDPTELEMLRWIKTLRDSGGDGPVAFEAMESEEEEEDEEEDEEEEDEDEDEDSSSSSEKEKAATRVAREKKRRGADASRARDAAPPAKKPKAAESSAGKASAAAAAFVAAKAFGGAKPGYYFRKGAKGLGYYLDANANARKTETAKKEKKSSVFSVPREQAEFQPAKRFSGAKPGFVFKKGARGLGYYLDRPPKVTWKGGGGGGARRGDWARNVGGGRRSGGKNKGGRGGRRF
jgi:ATP-dependent RNA helicase DDX5/DBP2